MLISTFSISVKAFRGPQIRWVLFRDPCTRAEVLRKAGFVGLQVVGSEFACDFLWMESQTPKVLVHCGGGRIRCVLRQVENGADNIDELSAVRPQGGVLEFGKGGVEDFIHQALG